jgi:cell division protein FtsB
MDYLKLIQRLCLIFSVMLLIGIVVRLFLPLIGHQKELRAREAELRLEIQQEAEALRMLRLKQERLQEDPRFVEKIAREKLGYAKPGETIFRFVDDDAP